MPWLWPCAGLVDRYKYNKDYRSLYEGHPIDLFKNESQQDVKQAVCRWRGANLSNRPKASSLLNLDPVLSKRFLSLKTALCRDSISIGLWWGGGCLSADPAGLDLTPRAGTPEAHGRERGANMREKIKLHRCCRKRSLSMLRLHHRGKQDQEPPVAGREGQSPAKPFFKLVYGFLFKLI